MIGCFACFHTPTYVDPHQMRHKTVRILIVSLLCNNNNKKQLIGYARTELGHFFFFFIQSRGRGNREATLAAFYALSLGEVWNFGDGEGRTSSKM